MVLIIGPPAAVVVVDEEDNKCWSMSARGISILGIILAVPVPETAGSILVAVPWCCLVVVLVTALVVQPPPATTTPGCCDVLLLVATWAYREENAATAVVFNQRRAGISNNIRLKGRVIIIYDASLIVDGRSGRRCPECFIAKNYGWNLSRTKF
jgi:hypothetical protein